MPRQAFNEELLESIVDHLKHHLNTNIYPFHSIAHCQIARLDLCQGEPALDLFGCWWFYGWPALMDMSHDFAELLCNVLELMGDDP